jgi:uncharacterized protein
MNAPRFGLGFRPRYFGDLVDDRPAVDWLELVSENFMAVGGQTRRMLDRLAADYPLALHGVSLSIAGAAALDEEHLAALRALADAVEPVVVSDHLSWTSWRGRESHDLLPIAYTRAMLAHVAARVAHVQERLGRRLVLENASAYVAFAAAEMEEAEFLAALCARSGCGVLLDVNNLVVNAANLGADPARYLACLTPADVVYFHVAGHSVLPDVRIDTHDEPVPDPVWALYADACARFPQAHTILERDERLPRLSELVDELNMARESHPRAARAVAGTAGVPPARRAGDTETRSHAPLAASRDPAAAADRGGDAPARRAGETPALPATCSIDVDATQRCFFEAIAGSDLLPGDQLFNSTTPVPPSRGVRVYREAYVARLQRGLRDNFPTLAKVLGAPLFDRLIADYVAAHPPRGWRFGTVGAALPGFIEAYRFEVGLAVSPAVLADVAALEQAELEVHDAPDDGVPLTYAVLDELTEGAWSGLRVRCSTGVRLLHWRADVLTVVSAAAAGSIPLPPEPSDGALLIGRQDGRIARRRLEAQLAAVVARLLAGAPLAEACDGDAEIGAIALVHLVGVGALRELILP